MMRKLLVGAGLAATLLFALAAPAPAHITVDPGSAPPGAEITLGFRVPNESTNANVTKVDIAFPLDHPLLGVEVEPLPGWTSAVTESKLNPPVQTDDGVVTQAVGEIAWTADSGGGTAPGQFQEFHVLVQQLPAATNEVAFKAVQTYSDGSVVRWIDPVVAGQPPPGHPTPILALTTPGAGGGTTATTSLSPDITGAATVDLGRYAKKAAVSKAYTVGVFGIIVGALGLIVAVVAVRRRPGEQPSPPATP